MLWELCWIFWVVDPKWMYLPASGSHALTNTLTIAFDSAGGGEYTIPPFDPGTVTEYSWTQEPYRGFLWPIYFSGLVPLTANLAFTSNTNGTFKGTFYSDPPFNVSGNFHLTGP